MATAYVFNGQRYGSMEEVQAAMAGRHAAPVARGQNAAMAPRGYPAARGVRTSYGAPAKTKEQVMADCDQLLNGDKGPLLQLVEKIFNHTAGANRALDPYECDALVKQLESEIGIGKPPQTRGNGPVCPAGHPFHPFVVQPQHAAAGLACGACQRGLPPRMRVFACELCNVAVCQACGQRMVPPPKEHVFELGDASQMMFRFDFSGNGTLDLQETSELVIHMIRVMRDSIAPPGNKGGTNFARKSPKEAGYAVGKQLGKGGQGAIHIAKNTNNGQSVVIKFYDKSNQNAPLQDIMDEFETLCSLDSPNIARVYEVFQDNANVYVITEPYSGGDLTTFTEKATAAGTQITHAWIQKVYMQILDGFIYLHGHKIMHCDMKEPNAMITDDKHWDNPRAVLIDFGLSKSFSKQSGTCGTPGYIPPEAWTDGLWTPRGDMFSLGVTMIKTWNSGQAPIEGSTIEQLQANTMRPINPQFYQSFPVEMQPLVRSMTAVQFQGRPTATQARNHACFKKLDSAPPPRAMLDGLAQAATKKAGIADAMAMFTARKDNLHAYKELNELFLALDADKNGSVTEEEMRSGLDKLGYPSSQVETMVANLCQGGSMEYTEFMARLLNQTRDNSSAAELSAHFQKIDRDGSGKLDVQEIRYLLSDPAVAQMIEGQSAEQVLASMDIDGKGYATFEDFRRAMNGESPPQALYPLGAQVEVKDGTKWVLTTVTEVNARDGSLQVAAQPDTSIGVNDQSAKLRPNGAVEESPWDVGAFLYYKSVSQNSWIPCQVIEKSVDGNVQVNIKPGLWFDAKIKASHLRTEQAYKSDRARDVAKNALSH